MELDLNWICIIYHSVLGAILNPQISRVCETTVFRFRCVKRTTPCVQYCPIPWPLLSLEHRLGNLALFVSKNSVFLKNHNRGPRNWIKLNIWGGSLNISQPKNYCITNSRNLGVQNCSQHAVISILIKTQRYCDTLSANATLSISIQFLAVQAWPKPFFHNFFEELRVSRA